MDGENPNRNENGRFAPGNKVNISGKNGHMKGYQPYGQRAAFWLDKLSNEELIALTQDKAAFGKLSVYDSIIITHLVDALLSEGRGLERERLLSRIEGQTKSSVDMSVNGEVKVKHDFEDSARRFIESKLAGIASRLGAAGNSGSVIEGTVAESPVRLEVLGETKTNGAGG